MKRRRGEQERKKGITRPHPDGGVKKGERTVYNWLNLNSIQHVTIL